MNNLQSHISPYLKYCATQKRLDEKTLKAYQIDLRQFFEVLSPSGITKITSEIFENHVATLHQKYKPNTVQRIQLINEEMH